jgi:chloramphenicol 3-O phosphotransferase
MTGRVVVLNGASSAGKSTLVDAFCARRGRRGELWVRTGIDDFIARLPAELVEIPGHQGEHAARGLRIVESDGVARVLTGPSADLLFAAYRRTVATWARLGLDVIVDEDAYDATAAADWAPALAGVVTMWVAIRCAPEVLLQRERARGDRVIGLAAGQLDVVYAHIRHHADIDTTFATVDECVDRLDALVDGFAFDVSS